MKTKKDHLIVYISVAVFAALLIMVGVFYSILGFDLLDTSSKDALTAGGTYEVLELAGMDQSAIGYCSAGVVEPNNKYKVLTVNGSSPFGEKGKYPVGRSFTLAWIGKLTDLEQDFLTF